MRPPCTFKGLVAILCVMATASGCDESVASTPAQSQAEAATASPLTGKWVDPAPVDANCSLSIEFHEDGSLALGDGHSTRLFDGKVASIDGQGFYKWDGRLRGETGTSQCPSGPDAGTAKAQESIYVRFAEGGARLALCQSPAVETCQLMLARSPDSAARPIRPADLGLAGPLGTALESLAGVNGRPATLMAQDAGPPVFITASGLTPVACEERAAWGVVAGGGLVGGVAAARCADGARVSQLTEARYGDPVLVAQVARGSAEQPALALVRETLPDGSTLTYFPVIATGHGVIVLWTATVVDSRKSSAVVVQATTSPNCQPSPRADSPRLCTDTKGTMIAVARALAAGPTR
jgi:hypothetical protein